MLSPEAERRPVAPAVVNQKYSVRNPKLLKGRHTDISDTTNTTSFGTTTRTAKVALSAVTLSLAALVAAAPAWAHVRVTADRTLSGRGGDPDLRGAQRVGNRRPDYPIERRIAERDLGAH